MTTEELLNILQANGITVTLLLDGHLHIHGNKRMLSPQLLSLIRERAHDIVYKLTQDDPATFDDEWKRYALWSWTKIEKEAQAMGDTKRESYSRMVLNMVINNDKNNNTQGS
jgi:hypothetical protein